MQHPTNEAAEPIPEETSARNNLSGILRRKVAIRTLPVSGSVLKTSHDRVPFPSPPQQSPQLLNSEGMVGSQSIIAAELDAPAHSRKRRLSEGALGLDFTTLMKGVTVGASPKTMPRANKRSKIEKLKSLSPSTELGLLREALMAKKDMVRTWQKKASEIATSRSERVGTHFCQL
jgi:hypothetical protein